MLWSSIARTIVVRCVVLTLLAELGPRIAPHLVRSLRLTQLTAGVAMRGTGPIGVVATSMGSRSGFLACWRLNIGIRNG